MPTIVSLATEVKNLKRFVSFTGSFANIKISPYYKKTLPSLHSYRIETNLYLVYYRIPARHFMAIRNSVHLFIGANSVDFNDDFVTNI